jgi:hypothetical protein
MLELSTFDCCLAVFCFVKFVCEFVLITVFRTFDNKKCFDFKCYINGKNKSVYLFVGFWFTVDN